MTDAEVTPRPIWLHPLADPKNELILRAAFDVFQEQGLHGATMLEIASRARVSKETLYTRFESKEGLFYALIGWGFREFAADFDRFAQEPIEDPVAELHAFGRALMTSIMHAESLEAYRLAISEAARQPEIGRNYHELACMDRDAVIARLVPALAARGLIEQGDLAEMTHAFCGLIRGNYQHATLMRMTRAPTPEEIDVRARRAVDLFLRAYAPRAMPAQGAPA